jgi:hypothetical protein
MDTIIEEITMLEAVCYHRLPGIGIRPGFALPGILFRETTWS